LPKRVAIVGRLLLLGWAISFFFVTPAYADIGLPMIFITVPNMLLAIVPIIALESYILSKKLKLTPKRSLVTSTVVNVASTFIGIPFAWFILALLQIITGGGRAYGMNTVMQKFLSVTWQAPWLIPYESSYYWMIPAALCFLLIPFFFVSWLIEYILAKKILPDVLYQEVKKAVFIANLASYGGLLVIGLFILTVTILRY